MPRLTLGIDIDLNDPDDVQAGDAIMASLRKAALEHRGVKINAETPPKGSTSPEGQPAVSQATENPTPAGAAAPAATVLDGLAGSNGQTGEAGQSSPATNGQTATTPASPSSGRKRAPRVKDPKDIEIKDGAGERIASFLNPADAAGRIIFEVEKLTTAEAVHEFGKANLEAMGHIAQKDKEAINKVSAAMAAHVQKIKSGQIPTTAAADDAAAATTTQPSSTSDSVNAGPAKSSDTEAELAALFAAPAATPTAVEMPRDDFLKEMIAFARAAGTQEGAAWMNGEGFKDINSVPSEKYAAMVASAKKRLEELKAKTA